MPLNWNDRTVPSETNKTTDILEFRESSSVGQLIYHPFRFRKYKLNIDKNGTYYATPFCRPGYEPDFSKEDFLSGQSLLASLCNLAMQVNRFDNKIPYMNLIIEWCTYNMHPYNIDFIYSELNKSFNINSLDTARVEKEGTFEIDMFLDDLGKLYNAVMFYVALEDLYVIDNDTTYDVSKEGKYFEVYSFLDKHKLPFVTLPINIDYRNTKETLIKKMRIDARYIKNHSPDKSSTDVFDTALYDNYCELQNTLIDIIPEFVMKLKVDSHTNRLEFTTDTNSVFDIAWLTLAKMISETPPLEEKAKANNHPECTMIRCRNCGKL